MHMVTMLPGSLIQCSVVLLLVCVLLDSCGRTKVTGATPLLKLSPSGVAPVCSGDQLEVICNTTETHLEWAILRIPDGASSPVNLGGALMEYQSPADQTLTYLLVNSVLFNFSRVSPASTLPMISMLAISPANSSINGTEVICRDVAQPNISQSAFVHVINRDSIQDHPTLNFTWTVEEPINNGINITLMWAESLCTTLYSHLINIIPETSHAFTEMNITIELVSNRIYNVSIVATPVCRPTDQISSPILHAGLFYRDCGGQFDGLKVVDYMNPAANGMIFRDCLPEAMSTPMGVTDVSKIIGGVVGSLLGVIICSILVSVVIIFILIRKKDLMTRYKRKPQDERSIPSADIELDSPRNDDQSDSKNASKGLVYAEIGQSFSKHQQNQQSTLLALDDGHIEYAQLNHKLLNEKSTFENEAVDEPLIVNLDNLLIQLRPQVSSKWYQFGVAAGIDKEVLDKFAQQCSPDDCIIEMLDFWLRKQKHLPTWRDVAKILKEIKLPQLALSIEGVYMTGKLPVEVDMNSISQFQQDNFDVEPPPPIPPKMVQDWDENSTRQQPNKLCKSRITPQFDNSLAPALPPKPNACESLPANVPARPPKPSARAPNHA